MILSLILDILLEVFVSIRVIVYLFLHLFDSLFTFWIHSLICSCISSLIHPFFHLFFHLPLIYCICFVLSFSGISQFYSFVSHLFTHPNVFMICILFVILLFISFTYAHCVINRIIIFSSL